MIGGFIGKPIGGITSQEGIAADLSVTLGDATLSATGVLAIVGTETSTLDDATLSATGALDIKAELTATLEDAILSAASQLLIQGIVEVTLDDATAAAILENVDIGSNISGGQFSRGKWRKIQAQIAAEREAESRRKAAEERRRKAEEAARRAADRAAIEAERAKQAQQWETDQLQRDLIAAKQAQQGAGNVSGAFLNAMAQRAMAEQAAQLAAQQEEEEVIMLLLAS